MLWWPIAGEYPDSDLSESCWLTICSDWSVTLCTVVREWNRPIKFNGHTSAADHYVYIEWVMSLVVYKYDALSASNQFILTYSSLLLSVLASVYLRLPKEHLFIYLLVCHGDTLFKRQERSRQDFKELQSDFSTNSQWFAKRDLSSKRAWRVSGVPSNYLQIKPLTERGAKPDWIDSNGKIIIGTRSGWTLRKLIKRFLPKEMGLSFYI